MGRREYVNDPQAPKPTSLVPAVSAVVTDKDGQLLLQAREAVIEILQLDPDLSKPANQPIKGHLASLRKTAVNWAKIS